MNTLGWGPYGWDYLFTIGADIYRQKASNIYHNVDDSKYCTYLTKVISNVLPCRHCRKAWGELNDKRLLFNQTLEEFILERQGDAEAYMFWLYCAKRFVTRRLIYEENLTMLKFLKEKRNFNLSKIDIDTINDQATFNKNFTTVFCNYMKSKYGKIVKYHKIKYDGITNNILRINRELPSYISVFNYYVGDIDNRIKQLRYFRFFYAVAFNACTKNGETNKINIHERKNMYIKFLDPDIIPNQTLSKMLKDLEPDYKKFIKENCASYSELVHSLIYNSELLRNLPKDFELIIKEMKKWKVGCSNNSDLLKTCRSTKFMPEKIFKNVEVL